LAAIGDLFVKGADEFCMPESAAAEARVSDQFADVAPAKDVVLDLKGWDDVANWNRHLFDFAVSNAAAFGNIGQFEVVLEWCSLAAWFASRHGYCGKLSSMELEAELLRAAKSLAVPKERARQHPPRRWLHVLSQGYETLGHTNLCRRWIEYSRDLVHDVILLEQNDSIPNNLNAAAHGTGGQCIALDTTMSLLERAALLRAYAWEHADLVVLHTHPEDAIAATAFGIQGGPPVMLVNHADHSFWVGCSIADIVLDIRDSGHSLTKTARGVDRAVILPVPLSDQWPSSAEERLNERAKIRKRLAIPERATVLLTVGSAVKYRSMPGLDFVATATEIIRQCPDTYLIAVGPEDKGEWSAARKATGGRILPIGHQRDTGPFCCAADIYLEGFPTGSLTAFLEAGLAGLPCVRSPRECVPPFCSDGLSLRDTPQPADLKDYVSQVQSLAADSHKGVLQGQELQEATKRYHCLPAWPSYVRDIHSLLPETHAIYPQFASQTVSSPVRNWFVKYLFNGVLPKSWTAIVVPFFVQAWKRTSSEPLLDRNLIDLDNHDRGNQRRVPGRKHSLLRHLNQKIRRQGGYERCLHSARQEFTHNNLKAARRLSYKCVTTNPLCIAKMEWWKLLVKVHGGYGLAVNLQRIVRSLDAKRGRRNLSTLRR
jgi:hypothetical protein